METKDLLETALNVGIELAQKIFTQIDIINDKNIPKICKSIILTEMLLKAIDYAFDGYTNDFPVLLIEKLKMRYSNTEQS